MCLRNLMIITWVISWFADDNCAARPSSTEKIEIERSITISRKANGKHQFDFCDNYCKFNSIGGFLGFHSILGKHFSSRRLFKWVRGEWEMGIQIIFNSFFNWKWFSYLKFSENEIYFFGWKWKSVTDTNQLYLTNSETGVGELKSRCERSELKSIMP